MVKLWPWRGEDTSPASFERALSTLSDKISKSQIQLDSLRQQSRRIKALWTLYTSFAYILCLIILALVVKVKNWTALEFTAISGSPVVIYLIRTAITAFYQYRIDKVIARLDALQTERSKTIDKLKDATKYNSTQQLLEKYGGAPPSASPSPSNRKPKGPGASPSTPRSTSKLPQRTTMGPPPTANIPGRNMSLQPRPSTPQAQKENPLGSSPIQVSTSPMPPPQETAEFAPNAFSGAPQYSQGDSLVAEGHWYDRVLDLLLGEDETLPKNRMALICQHCRLVNGQAPPGVNRLQDVGKWRCGGCGGWNGEMDEGTKIVKELTEKVQMEKQEQPGRSSEEELVDAEDVDDEGADDGDNTEEDSVLVETPVPRKRGRPKGSGKKK